MVIIGGALRIVDRHLPILFDRFAPDCKEENLCQDIAKHTIRPNDLDKSMLFRKSRPV